MRRSVRILDSPDPFYPDKQAEVARLIGEGASSEGKIVRVYLNQVTIYASWLNPIEKLWRGFKQALLHMHKLADDLPRLRSAIDRFLDRFASGSEQQLRHVGLCDG